MTERINELRELFFNGDHKKYRVEDMSLSILNDETEKLPFCVRKALSFKLMLEKMPIFLQGGELIVGGKTVYKLPEYVTQYEKEIGNQNFETKGYNNAFDITFNLGQDDRGFGLADSSIPAYGRILSIGLPGLVADVKARLCSTDDRSKSDYYNSVIISCKAAIGLIHRYESLLRDAASDSPDNRATELEIMANNLCVLTTDAPQTYWQAVQLMYFIHFLIWAEGGYLIPLGRLDQILYPYYADDKKSETLTDDFALEIMESFFLKLNYEIDRTHGENGKFESDTGQSVTIGGVRPEDGSDASNELTYMVLEAKCDMRMTDPKVHLRVHKDTPGEIWKKAAYLNSLGMGFPTYENDDAIIPAFMTHDCYTLEDARDYSASGCWEMIIQGKSLNRNLGMVDCLRALEWALNNGQYFLGIPGEETAVGLIDGKYGLSTGRVEWFDTFDKLFNAFKVQIKHGIDMVSSYCNRSQLTPAPFYSAFMDDCIEKGKDISDGGCRYYETDFQLASLTNAADSLCAIKKLCYDDKEYTLCELVDILKSNWEGNELLRQRILNEFPKFGNDDDEVDFIAKEIVDFYTREVTKHRNSFGGPYRARISSALGYVVFSQNLGASADGRVARGFTADNLSPHLGADREGPTSVINSCGKLNYKNLAGGAVLDMKFHPSSLKTDEGREKFSALIKAYFEKGGEQVQINVTDNATLLDAKAHPENYRDLMVRVWGFSTYFISLPEKYQDHIIARTTFST